jgi:lysophospholipase L1-like esterase
VHFVGRHDASNPDAVRFSWSGTGAVIGFDGTGVGVRLDDAAGFFTVVVDGQPELLQTSPGEQLYTLASDLAPGEHVVELYRRTEGSFGPTTFLGVELQGDLLPPPLVQRHMEVVGDSITCGYGNEGTDPCSFSADTENHYSTYAAIAAREVGAELSTVAWSGKGLVFNFGDDTFEPMPQIYDRVIATEPAAWDYTTPADVVVINLGTNDFSTEGDPSEQMFVSAYVDFLAHIRDVHPEAFILPVAPLLFGDEAQTVPGYIQQAVDQRHDAGDTDIAFADINVEARGWGCDGHPNLQTHAAMAEALVAQLQTHVGW